MSQKNVFYIIDRPDLLYKFWIERKDGKRTIEWKQVYDDAGLMMSGGSLSEAEFLEKFKRETEIIEAYHSFTGGKDV